MDRDKIKKIVEEKYTYSYETLELFKLFVDCLLDKEMFNELDEDSVLDLARDIAIVHEHKLEEAKK
jgi:hypothetical protein